MRNTTLRIVRDYDDDLNGPGSNFASATLPVEVVGPKNTKPFTGPRCVKCEHPLQAEVVNLCKKCGWHPRLSIYMEVDPEWGSASGGEQPSESTHQLNHSPVWIDLILRWGWFIIGSVFMVIVASIAVRWFIAAVL